MTMTPSFVEDIPDFLGPIPTELTTNVTLPIEATYFLSIIAPDGNVTFQTFDDRKYLEKAKSLIRILHGTTADNASTLQDLNQRGAGIFVMVNRGDGEGRKASNVTQVRAVFVDIDEDGATQLAKLDVLPLQQQPRLVIESSPGKYQCYWLLDGELPLDRFKDVQHLFADRWGGDRSICDLPRVLRVPGFYHNKNTPFLTLIIRDNPTSLPLSVETLLADVGQKQNRDQKARKSKKMKKISAVPFHLPLPEWVSDALEYVDPTTYDTWMRVGMALKHHADTDEMLQVWIAWSRTAPSFNEDECRFKWSTYEN
jgi:hypothetical protein